jgi:hypothetical protein
MFNDDSLMLEQAYLSIYEKNKKKDESESESEEETVDEQTDDEGNPVRDAIDADENIADDAKDPDHKNLKNISKNKIKKVTDDIKKSTD